MFCIGCYEKLPLIESEFEVVHYVKLSEEKYGDDAHWYEFLVPEIVEKSEINLSVEEALKKHDKSVSTVIALEEEKRQAARQAIANPNVPKCPTCGSTKIEKISALRRGTHAVAFGLLSKTARSQFECKNCGYKW